MELKGVNFNPTGTTHFVVQPKDDVQLHFEKGSGKLFFGDSLKWLATLESETVDLVFADPPYNIKKADWDDFDSHDEYIEWSTQWMKEAARVLKKDGTLFVCNFSEILADMKVAAMPFFKRCRWLVWHYKNKANLGSDWGRSHESILHFRRSEERRVGKECPSKCRSRWSPYH